MIKSRKLSLLLLQAFVFDLSFHYFPDAARNSAASGLASKGALRRGTPRPILVCSNIDLVAHVSVKPVNADDGYEDVDKMHIFEEGTHVSRVLRQVI
jgi:hypothetical protein